MNLLPEVRQRLARDLKIARQIEMKRIMPDQKLNEKRDRSANDYLDHLRGLEATLRYAAGLPITVLVDHGAGSSRAIAQIAQSEYGEGLAFLGTGIVHDPEIDNHIGRDSYKITPAETMRGFTPSSVGGFISVYGPFEHSAFLDLVLEKTDELLIPDGIIKLCVMKETPGRGDEVNALKTQRLESIGNFFMNSGYGLATVDWDITDRIGANRTFLGIKPGLQGGDLNLLALTILENDLRNIDTMKANLQ